MTKPATPLRSDAHRNRKLIIAAACAVFLEQGPDAPLEEVARRAGVGIATLYRRFPDRHELVQQVALENLSSVEEELDRAADEQPDAWATLKQLLERVVELRLIVFPVLAPALDEDLRRGGGELNAQRNRLYERMEQLASAATEEGQLRQGINPIDIWLGVIKLTRPLPTIGDEANRLIIARQLDLFLGSLNAVPLDASQPLHQQPLTLADLDRSYRRSRPARERTGARSRRSAGRSNHGDPAQGPGVENQ